MEPNIGFKIVVIFKKMKDNKFNVIHYPNNRDIIFPDDEEFRKAYLFTFENKILIQVSRIKTLHGQAYLNHFFRFFENGKLIASANEFPEENEVEVWTFPDTYPQMPMSFVGSYKCAESKLRSLGYTGKIFWNKQHKLYR